MKGGGIESLQRARLDRTLGAHVFSRISGFRDRALSRRLPWAGAAHDRAKIKSASLLVVAVLHVGGCWRCRPASSRPHAAVAHARARGVVHPDIKPGNIVHGTMSVARWRLWARGGSAQHRPTDDTTELSGRAPLS